MYSLTTVGPHRVALVILSGLSLIASMAGFRVLGLRLVETQWSKLFFSSWAACTFVFVAVGAVLDGGVRSPISYFLILPMLFAGLAYSAARRLPRRFRRFDDAGCRAPDSRSQLAEHGVPGCRNGDRGCHHGSGGRNRDRLMRQLMAAASLDALTGCLSRGAFQERLDHESLLAERHYATFSLIVADLDNLKLLNDANGHHCGDRALKLLAGVLRQAAGRPTSSAASAATSSRRTARDRSGGAMAAATRLRMALHDVTGSDWVTVSIGVSTWLGPNDAPEALLRRADEALYMAKRSGRDCAAQWEPPSTETTPVGLQ